MGEWGGWEGEKKVEDEGIEEEKEENSRMLGGKRGKEK